MQIGGIFTLLKLDRIKYKIDHFSVLARSILVASLTGSSIDKDDYVLM